MTIWGLPINWLQSLKKTFILNASRIKNYAKICIQRALSHVYIQRSSSSTLFISEQSSPHAYHYGTHYACIMTDSHLIFLFFFSSFSWMNYVLFVCTRLFLVFNWQWMYLRVLHEQVFQKNFMFEMSEKLKWPISVMRHIMILKFFKNFKSGTKYLILKSAYIQNNNKSFVGFEYHNEKRFGRKLGHFWIFLWLKIWINSNLNER